MRESYILAIDQGTTGTRAALINKKGEIKGIAYKEINQFFPQPGWVEHDPEEIWQKTCQVIDELFLTSGISGRQIAAIGITNQRETTIIWDRKTGKPLCRGIVWQCRRTAPLCEKLIKEGFEEKIKSKTGLVIDPYFSATKIRWILDNIKEAEDKAERRRLLFGTVDSWLIWKLTSGTSHLTDYTNASRTMLFNIQNLSWDEELLDIFKIPPDILPRAVPSAGIFGYTKGNFSLPDGIPISGVAGDQQAALFGQACFYPGMAKNTYGTGCFLLLNCGNKRVDSEKGLLTSICCNQKGEPAYALEGSVFIAGAAIKWLKEGLGLIEKAEDTESIAKKVKDTEGVYFVPAFVGLGAPYWDRFARGAILGITRGTKREHIIRAALESIAYQTEDILEVMQEESGIRLEEIRVDGGVSKNDWLMQFQADILNVRVIRPFYSETTVMGAGFLAGLGIGWWKAEDLYSMWRRGEVFYPQMEEEKREKLYSGWKEAVRKVLSGKIE